MYQKQDAETKAKQLRSNFPNFLLPRDQIFFWKNLIKDNVHNIVWCTRELKFK